MARGANGSGGVQKMKLSVLECVRKNSLFRRDHLLAAAFAFVERAGTGACVEARSISCKLVDRLGCMPNTVGSFEAKTHLPALLERVVRGERITITKRGIPVAMLVPVENAPVIDRKRAIAELKEFGRGRKLPDGMTVRDLIDAGRRF